MSGVRTVKIPPAQSCLHIYEYIRPIAVTMAVWPTNRSRFKKKHQHVLRFPGRFRRCRLQHHLQSLNLPPRSAYSPRWVDAGPASPPKNPLRTLTALSRLYSPPYVRWLRSTTNTTQSVAWTIHEGRFCGGSWIDSK